MPVSVNGKKIMHKRLVYYPYVNQCNMITTNSVDEHNISEAPKRLIANYAHYQNGNVANFVLCVSSQVN